MNKKHKKIDLEDISKEEIYENLQRCISEKIDYWNRINEAIEYCEDITSREIDISDTDYDLGEDSVARDILDILRGKNNE